MITTYKYAKKLADEMVKRGLASTWYWESDGKSEDILIEMTDRTDNIGAEVKIDFTLTKVKISMILFKCQPGEKYPYLVTRINLVEISLWYILTSELFDGVDIDSQIHSDICLINSEKIHANDGFLQWYDENNNPVEE